MVVQIDHRGRVRVALGPTRENPTASVGVEVMLLEIMMIESQPLMKLMTLHHPGSEHRVEVEHVIRRRRCRSRNSDDGSDARNLVVLEGEPHRARTESTGTNTLSEI